MKLPCPSTQCNSVTEEVLTLLTMHKEIDHPGNSPVAAPQSCQRKPEKFPRPNITMDTTAEAWQDFYTSSASSEAEVYLVPLLGYEPSPLTNRVSVLPLHYREGHMPSTVR